jgi:hypothetical protein
LEPNWAHRHFFPQISFLYRNGSQATATILSLNARLGKRQAMPQAVHYRFTQRFNQPARKAYDWCTDFTPEDQVLMREKNATREVQQLTKNTVILTDTFHKKGETTVKQKLVCLYPNKLMWTSTHLAGPARYSQFIYEITSESKTTSSLRFTALHVAHCLKEDSDKTENRCLAEELRKEDSDVWKNLANELEKELGRGRP